MEPDDRVCYCFSVTLRKLLNFARIEEPQRASQMSECFGAGTGCGWCIPTLIEIFEVSRAGREPRVGLPPREYEEARARYIETKQPKNTF